MKLSRFLSLKKKAVNIFSYIWRQYWEEGGIFLLFLYIYKNYSVVLLGNEYNIEKFRTWIDLLLSKNAKFIFVGK